VSPSGRELAIDAGAVATVTLGILAFGERPALMWVVLGLTLAGRFALWLRLTERTSLRVELIFFALSTLLGALNDYNTVVWHGVYSYELPSELPALSSIPLWMLVFWGLIVRCVFTLSRWRALGPARPRGSWRRLAFIAAVLVVTRQCIYVFYEHPLLSWLPFAVAIALWVLVVGLDPREWRLAALALLVGPLAESLLIEVGGLHRYALGWLGGVPLWWVLATWIWKDLGLRAQGLIERWVGPSPRSLARTPAGP